MTGSATPADANDADARLDAVALAVPAADRILEAAARVLATRGATGLAMQEVAEVAGVSKGLIHYHYRDKDALLARLAGWLADRVADREEAALADVGAGEVVDALWRWLEQELAAGEVRGLLELALLREGTARAAARDAAARRRAQAEGTVETLFTTLGLRPRIPAGMMAEVFVAFVDGLALDAPAGAEAAHRVAFDVFWLAMLSLAE